MKPNVCKYCGRIGNLGTQCPGCGGPTREATSAESALYSTSPIRFVTPGPDPLPSADPHDRDDAEDT
jgi:hypothetical protein